MERGTSGGARRRAVVATTAVAATAAFVTGRFAVDRVVPRHGEPAKFLPARLVLIPMALRAVNGERAVLR